MKKPIQIAIAVLVGLIGLSVAKNALTQTILTSTLSSVAHVPVRIGSVNLSFLSASIRLRNLQMHNPSGFSERLMIDIPQIYIDFEPSELFHGRARFKEVRLDLKEMTVVRNRDGRLNVDAVKPTEKQRAEAHEKAKPAEGAKPPKLFIDKLFLSVGKVVYKDYSGGGQPVVQSFDINIKYKEYDNIDNPASVVSLVMFEALTRTTLSRIANLDVSSFKEGGIQALSQGLGLVTDGTDAAQTATKQLLNLLK